MIGRLFAFILFALAAAPAAADVAAGLEAYRRGDYAAALAAWRPLAKSGDSAAQYNLAILYRRGQGVAADNKKAFWWFERAAGRGHTRAQYNLGLIYERGIGVTPNRAAALRWYRRAAKQEPTDTAHIEFKDAHARAQYRLANMLLGGGAVDRSAALYWIQRSSENGYAAAQFQLALAYASGDDMARDPVVSARWLRRAADQGHAAAQVSLAALYESGSGVARDDAAAARWYALAAEQGVAEAQLALGTLYARGRGVPRDDRAALRWYRRAATLGAERAPFKLGALYEHSADLDDPEQAYFWYAVAARTENTKAGLRLVALRKEIGAAAAATVERRAANWRPDAKRKRKRARADPESKKK